MAFDVEQYTEVVKAAKDLKRASRMVQEWTAKEQEAQKRLEALTSGVDGAVAAEAAAAENIEQVSEEQVSEQPV